MGHRPPCPRDVDPRRSYGNPVSANRLRYCAANDPRVHFRLGSQNEVGEVRVTWQDGHQEWFAHSWLIRSSACAERPNSKPSSTPEVRLAQPRHPGVDDGVDHGLSMIDVGAPARVLLTLYAAVPWCVAIEAFLLD